MDIHPDIVGRTIVPHKAWNTAHRRIYQCFEYAFQLSNPMCYAVIGEARTGKTFVTRYFYRKFPAYRTDAGLIVPVVWIKTPAKPNPKSLAEEMLFAMQEPYYNKDSENVKTNRLIGLLQNAQTRLLIIDDFQHFYDKTTQKVWHYVADWLKNVVDRCQIGLVVTGLETCRNVIEQNEQLEGRFGAPVILTRFDWRNEKDDRKEFLGILESFHIVLSAYFDLPAFDTEEMGFRWYCATGGLIGYIAKVLEKMVLNAIDATFEQRAVKAAEHESEEASEQPKHVLTLKDLETAHVEAVWAREGFIGIPSPFSAEFNFKPDDRILAMARQIGTKAEPDDSRQPQSRKAPRAMSVGQELTIRS